jgi:hypothetical protein
VTQFFLISLASATQWRAPTFAFLAKGDAANTYTTGFVQNGQSRVVEELMKHICLGYLEPGKNVLAVHFNFRNENQR